MAPNLNYSRKEHLEKELNNRDFKITSQIVEGILDAMFKNKTIAIIFSASFEDGSDDFTLSIKRKDWKQSLSKCLPDYELKELYEKCAEIKKAIDSLEEID